MKAVEEIDRKQLAKWLLKTKGFIKMANDMDDACHVVRESLKLAQGGCRIELPKLKSLQ